MGVIAVGDLLWATTYLLIIIKGFRDRSYGMPLVAVALNFTWEVYFTFVSPPRSPGGGEDHVKFVLFAIWFVLDAIIVLQVFLYGRETQDNPYLKKYFYPVVAITLVMAYAGHHTFARFFHEPEGKVDAYIINFVMSLLFVHLLFNRPRLQGLSLPAAWTKMLGTGIISVANVLLLQIPPRTYPGFFYLLFAGVFSADVIYLYLLHRAVHSGSGSLPPPVPAPRPAPTPAG